MGCRSRRHSSVPPYNNALCVQLSGCEQIVISEHSKRNEDMGANIIVLKIYPVILFMLHKYDF